MDRQLPHHTGACRQQGTEQMEQTLPVCGGLTPRCRGLGVRKMADYKHLNNNTTTQADASPLGRREKTSLGKIHLKNTMEEE